MKTDTTRKKWEREFKINAVNMYRDTDKSCREIEEDLGIPHGNVSRWNRELKDDDGSAFPGNGRLRSKDEEIMRLKKQNADLKMERDILKKAMAIFSKPQK